VLCNQFQRTAVAREGVGRAYWSNRREWGSNWKAYFADRGWSRGWSGSWSGGWSRGWSR